MSHKSDEEYMRVALGLARRGRGRTAPNPAVGCVLVRNGVVIGRGWTADGGRPHAEAQALAQAEMEANGAIRGATAYVTLEPCNHHGQTPPCSSALVAAGLVRVVVACTDPDPRTAGAGIETLRAAGIQVDVGALEREALALNKGFFLRVTDERPLVTLKLAVSADGKIAAGAGQRTQISGARSGAYMHLLRSQHDAILVGAGTALADDPQLTTRIAGYEHDSLRVVLDGQGCLPQGSKLARAEDNVLILTNDGVDTRNLSAVLGVLAQRGVTRLLVEGGAQIHASFLEAELCDQFYLTRAPHEIGEGGVEALAHGHDIFNLSGAFALSLRRSISLGEDLLEIYERSA